ncbi:MAG: glycerophosphoryl diester phosphodiesterase membrane domain-containing protein, partial [Solirubrobacterales bacterium]|nr:glycerophosphoryl diester phosphodiesterase membrane domain-containing protein [Solirubrobacterales bacterium]
MNNYISIDRLLHRSLFVFKKRLGRLAALSGLLLVTLALIVTLIVALVAIGSGGSQPFVFVLIVIGILLVGAAIAAMSAFNASVVRVVEAEERGLDLGGILDVIKSVKTRIWPEFWVGLLASVATVVGYFIFLIPGIYLGVVWAVVTPVIVVEGLSLDALARSRQLVKGNGWGVFGFGLVAILVLLAVAYLLMLAVVLVAALLGAIIGGSAGGGVAGVAMGVAYLAFYVVALPVTGVIGSVLYFELGGLDGHSVPQSTPAPAVPVAP